MNARIRPLLMSLVLAGMTVGCSTGATTDTDVPTTPVAATGPGAAGGASGVAESGRGQPAVVRLPVDEEFGCVSNFFCPALDVSAHVVGQVVIQSWTSGTEQVFRSETNVRVTFTNCSTGASVTNHQTNATECRLVDSAIEECTDSGGFVRVVSPGGGIVSQETGHVAFTIDYSVWPPSLTDFSFKGHTAGSDICTLIG